jgi:hypothetical protein
MESEIPDQETSHSFGKLKQSINGEESSATFSCGGTININNSSPDGEKVSNLFIRAIQEPRLTGI